MTDRDELRQEWWQYDTNPVSVLAIGLQRHGYLTDVLETSLTGHGKDKYLMRYWREDPGNQDPTTYLLMGDLGITWEPARQWTTEELGRISAEDGPEAAVEELVRAARDFESRKAQ